MSHLILTLICTDYLLFLISRDVEKMSKFDVDRGRITKRHVRPWPRIMLNHTHASSIIYAYRIDICNYSITTKLQLIIAGVWSISAVVYSFINELFWM